MLLSEEEIVDKFLLHFNTKVGAESWLPEWVKVGVREAIFSFAAEIAEAAAADKADALAAQDAAWHDIEDKHLARIEELKAENERLRARVKKLKKQRDDWKAMWALGDMSEGAFYAD